jgi:hypothetical protein
MGRRKDDAQFNMRLGKPLLKRLQNAAKDQNRSVNSEMVRRVEQSFSQSGADQINSAAQQFLDLAIEKLMSSDDPDSELRWFRPGEEAAEVLSQELYRKAGREYLAGRIAEGDRLRLMALALCPHQEPELPMTKLFQPRQSKGGKS